MSGGEFQRVFGYAPLGDAEHEDEPVPHAWFAAPQDELGSCVPLSLVVGRSETGVVAIAHVTAYSTGVQLAVRAAARGLSVREAQRLMHGLHGFAGDEELDEAFLRIGIEFADGRKASNIGGHGRLGLTDDEPEGPVLVEHRGGSGGGGRGSFELHAEYWLWPLPPPGPLRIFVEWPALDIALSHAELDADALRAAASRARPLWNA